MTGLLFGSFFNVVGLRIPEGKSIVFPGSRCPKCGHPLSGRDLIPVFSYIALGGKCRYCGVKISVIYPVMEGTCGFLFSLAYVRFGWSPELVFALLFLSLLAIITVSDLAYMVIPNRILLGFFPFIVLYRIMHPLKPWWDAILGGLVGFSVLYFLSVISRGGMGGGDIKLFAVIGVALGTKATILAMFLSSIIGTVVCGFLFLRKKLKRKDPIPFGPFIAAGAAISYFFVESIFHWYLRFLFGYPG